MRYDEMEQAGPYLRRFFNVDDRRWYYYHWCPACEEPHQYVTGDAGNLWTFNYNYLEPTFNPSMRIQSSEPRNAYEEIRPVHYTRCHYFIRDGKIDFCSDSPHGLAGKTVPLPKWAKKK
jgi:hypothetical protein